MKNVLLSVKSTNEEATGYPTVLATSFSDNLITKVKEIAVQLETESKSIMLHQLDGIWACHNEDIELPIERDEFIEICQKLSNNPSNVNLVELVVFKKYCYFTGFAKHTDYQLITNRCAIDELSKAGIYASINQ